MAGLDAQVAVVGGGVVGCAVVHELARREVSAILFESQAELARAASGTNSGILHTGFDSRPGELETRLLLRSAELRPDLLEELAVPVWRCGARMIPRGSAETAAVARLSRNARANGVDAQLGEDGSLTVPGEAVTDPVCFTEALARAAASAGAAVRLRARVAALAGAPGGGVHVGLENGERVHVRAVVNCAGLFADEVARLAGDEPVVIYPRKGEFLVFSAPPGPPLERILLPVPSSRGKGVLVFPTIDGHVIAGPTAREREDKEDWSVEADAGELILARAVRMYPALADARPISAYAGLRPAGRDANYVIEPSRRIDTVIHVAAIRSTGLSASLGIGEHVAALLAERGAVSPSPARPLRAQPAPGPAAAWWERAAQRHPTAAGPGAA